MLQQIFASRAIAAMIWTRGLAIWALLLAVTPSGGLAQPLPTRPILLINTLTHTASINCVDRDARGGVLLTGSWDKSLRLWDFMPSSENGGDGRPMSLLRSSESPRLLRVLRMPAADGREGVIQACALAPDSREVIAVTVTANGSQLLNRFNAATGQMISSQAVPKEVNGLRYSPDGRFLALTYNRGGIDLYKMPEFVRLDSVSNLWTTRNGRFAAVSGRMYYAVATSERRPDGSDGASSVRLYHIDQDRLQLLRTFTDLFGNHVSDIQIAPDGKRIAVAYGDDISNQVDVFSFPDFLPTYALRSSKYRPLRNIAWTANGTKLFATTRVMEASGFVVLAWDLQRRGEPQELGTHAGDALSALVPVGASDVAFASGDGSFGRFAADGRLLFASRQDLAAVGGWTADEADLALAKDGRTARVLVRDQLTGDKVPLSYSFHSRTTARKATTGKRTDLISPIVLSADRRRAPETDMTFDPAKGVLAGGKLLLESSETFRVASVSPSRQGDWFVAVGFSFAGTPLCRAYDRSGALLWSTRVAAFGVPAISEDGRYVVVLGNDGVIRWFRAKDGTELLSLVLHSDGKRWISWTPSGYFDSSFGADSMIGWQINRGRNQSPDFLPVDRFYEHFYRPDVIAEMLARNESDRETVGRLGIDEPMQITQGIRPPPRASFFSPSEGTSVAEANIVLRYFVQDSGGGVGAVRVFQNGKALPERRGLARIQEQGRQDHELSVQLAPGRNVFRVVALSSEGTEGEPAELTVFLQQKAEIAPPQLHVLLVGVNRYRNAALNLFFAEADVQALAEFLDSPPVRSLYQNVNISRLLNTEATRRNVLTAFEQLSRSARPQDTVIIFFAGHGDTVMDEWYFVPYEVTTPEVDEALVAGGISRTVLQGGIKSIPAQKVLVLLDACKSGAATQGARGLEDRKAIAQLARSTGVYVVGASDSSQAATEIAQLGHGVFTYSLLQGLRGQAGKKRVTAEGLIAYVKEALPELTEKYFGGAQYPISWGGGSDFPIALYQSRESE